MTTDCTSSMPVPTRAGTKRKKRPAARAKPSKPVNVGNLIDHAFNKRVVVIDQGKATRVTVFAAIFKLLWTKEMGGDRRALIARVKYESFARMQKPARPPNVIVTRGLPHALDLEPIHVR